MREKWHATSALDTQTLSTMDRPTIMSLVFGVALLFSIASVVAAPFFGVDLLWVALSVVLVPLFTAMYRAHKFRQYRYIPELTVLWGVFYLVRLHNMFSYLFVNRAVSA